jgi:hypothetical protein
LTEGQIIEICSICHNFNYGYVTFLQICIYDKTDMMIIQMWPWHLTDIDCEGQTIESLVIFCTRQRCFLGKLFTTFFFFSDVFDLEIKKIQCNLNLAMSFVIHPGLSSGFCYTSRGQCFKI